MMMSLLKYKGVSEFIEMKDDEDDSIEEATQCTFLLKRNISNTMYYLVRNLTNPGVIWRTLERHFGSQSRAWIRNKKRELLNVTIESCSYDVDQYLQKKADAIDELVAVDVNIEDQELADSILQGLETDYRFSDFIFFYEAQVQTDYMDLIARITEYSSSTTFQRKYGRKRNTKSKTKASLHLAQNANLKKKKRIRCGYCNKRGHTVAQCFKKQRDNEDDGKDLVLHLNYTSDEDGDKILLDSGATNHFFGSRIYFTNIEDYDGEVNTANGKISIVGIGDIRLQTTHRTVIIKNVFYSPDLKVNLLSMVKLEEKGVRYKCENGCRYLIHEENLLKIADIAVRRSLLMLVLKDEVMEVNNLHSSLGHLSQDKIKHLSFDINDSMEYPCDVCRASKGTRRTPKRKSGTHRHPYELVHSDICELPLRSIDGFSYFVSFIDDASRYAHLILMTKKSDVYEAFRRLLDEDEIVLGILRTDQGREYLSRKFSSLCMDENIRQEFTSSYTPEENGVSERYNRTIIEMVRTMLTESNLPQTFWSYASLQACFILNRSPHAFLGNRTPFEVLYEQNASYLNLHPFGCQVDIFVPKHKRNKLENPTQPGIFLGCVDNSTELIALNQITGEITVIPSTSTFYDSIFPEIKPDVMDKMEEKSMMENYFTEESSVPTSVKEVLSHPDRSKWIDAIKEEMKMMHDNEVFIEIPKEGLSNENVLSTRFVFTKGFSEKTKRMRWKARLVIRGFEEKVRDDIDVYAPTPPLEALRLLLAYWCFNDCYDIRSIDIKSAFLNAEITRDVYLTPPTGTRLRNGKNCWKLRKALYGLADAPKRWFETFTSCLSEIGLSKLSSEQCMMKMNHTLLFFYVDDLLLCGPENEVQEIILKLSTKFRLHDIGFPESILGMKLIKEEKGISIGMTESIDKLIEKYELIDAKTVDTPLPTGYTPPARDQMTGEEHVEKYRSLIGSLLYICRCCRPDIQYTVGLLSRYVEKHNFHLWRTVKRCLRYLKRTKEMTMKMIATDEENEGILIYADSSFADQTETRRSTMGTVIKWRGFVLGWSSKTTKSVVTSTAEAELYASVLAIKQALYLRNILQEIGYTESIKLLSDNQATIHWLTGSKSTPRLKHVDVSYHFVREMIANNTLSVEYITTEQQTADIMTKALPKALFEKHRDAMMGVRGVLEYAHLTHLP
jgi:transposase InsO family protein